MNSQAVMQKAPAATRSPLRLALIIGALGVVFGDIGTSPIYALQTVFNPDDPHPVPLTTENLYGVVSLVVWSVILIVTVTYVLLAMRMDNEGEGGIMALLTLLRRWAPKGARTRTVAVLSGLAVLGAALFLGDSMITPAISVLSAVEGLKTINPGLEEWIVPITATILFILFLIQKLGSSVVGRLFGPIMAVWFVVIGVLGIGGIVHDPRILLALSPTYAIEFMANHFGIAFFALAAVVLSVTGAEALYADMGHFGRKPISLAWLFLVFPALALTYLGQGALLLEDKANMSAPFFLLAPEWARIGLVLLATAATVIASQSVISGAFSVAAQASGLGYLPRLRVTHTSSETHGQIYVPWINWLLMVSVITLVFVFRSSASLAFAYGMAVIGTITITTLLFFYLARRRWKIPGWILWSGAVVLLAIDLLFLAANATKFVHGAWLPLAIGLLAFIVMTTWQRGRELITARRSEAEGSLADFVRNLRTHPKLVDRVPGTAIFLNPGGTTTPLALRANVEHNHVRHARVIILSVDVQNVPRVSQTRRCTVDDLGDPTDGILYISARFGYAEKPDLPRALRSIPPHKTQGWIDLDNATYFLSKIELREGRRGGMAQWRKRLFLAASHITTDASDHFGLPRDRVIVMGSQIEL